MRKPKWIYWKQIFNSEFQASCLKTKIEDNWEEGYELGPIAEVRKLKDQRYIVRYTYHD